MVRSKDLRKTRRIEAGWFPPVLNGSVLYPDFTDWRGSVTPMRFVLSLVVQRARSHYSAGSP
jgi:hypothetical protein